MYVWGRLARVAATSRHRGPYVMGSESRLAFRCLPGDVDTYLHMNNARYMMLADVGRYDIFMRSGLLSLGRQNGWAPLMGGSQSAYIREIKLWGKFEIISSFETWSGKQLLGRHRFVLETGDTAAIIMTTVGVRDFTNRRFVDIDEVAAALGHRGEPRPPGAEETAFMASHQELRALGKPRR